MPDSLQPLESLSALPRRWKRILAVGVGAGVIALAISLLLPKKYEATTLVLIQPPLGANAAAALSPAYLDSLRSFEPFVESDGVLTTLLHDTHLDTQFSPEQFRRSALRASVLKGTRVLQVSVILADPAKAHETALRLGQILRDENARMNREEGDRIRALAVKDAEEAHKTLLAVQSVAEQFRRTSREDEVRREAEAQIERKGRLEQDLNDSEMSLAEQEGRATSSGASAEAARNMTTALRAHVQGVKTALASMQAALAKSQADYAAIDTRRTVLDSELQAADDRYSSLARRVTDISSGAVRREEMEIADPGAVPSQPASPHPLQNTILAVLLGLLAASLYELWNANAARATAIREPSEERRPTAARW